MPDPEPPSRRLRRTLWATAAFLVGFTILISVIVFAYLIPAMEAAKHSDASHRHALSAYAALLMTIVLITLGVGLIMTFRVHRFFFPSRETKRTSTANQPSAWQESARRMQTPSAEDLEDSVDEDADFD